MFSCSSAVAGCLLQAGVGGGAAARPGGGGGQAGRPHRQAGRGEPLQVAGPVLPGTVVRCSRDWAAGGPEDCRAALESSDNNRLVRPLSVATEL